jgi:hypothetical protein
MVVLTKNTVPTTLNSTNANECSIIVNSNKTMHKQKRQPQLPLQIQNEHRKNECQNSKRSSTYVKISSPSCATFSLNNTSIQSIGIELDSTTRKALPQRVLLATWLVIYLIISFYIRKIFNFTFLIIKVGLGDRHVQNILIDTQTADLIHIDLGIAFEQGKILPIPETVPFRLTRDIVDGFGICAMEGLFKANCELALDLLKRSKEFILTIFEV